MPCMRRPEIHHSEVSERERAGAQGDTDRAPGVDLARDQPRVEDPQHGPEAAKISAVALTPPMTCTINAKIAG